jgi:putative transcriptional regulator
MPKKYKSKALAALHETVSDFHEIGLIDTKTMHHFDESCLVPVEYLEPSQIIETRNKAGVSQAVFAHYLNVSIGSVNKWERGEKHPSGSALKLLDLVRRKGLDAIV